MAEIDPTRFPHRCLGKNIAKLITGIIEGEILPKDSKDIYKEESRSAY